MKKVNLKREKITTVRKATSADVVKSGKVSINDQASLSPTRMRF
ncbi:hypothetical protein [Dyadobacter sp. CY323]|nr:hypothetical protein [Dyadobacter sp. CY323]